MLLLQHISYTHPNKDALFNDIDLSLANSEKVALVGNNGAGKSTLLKIIAGELQPTEGLLKTEGKVYYVPQVFGQYDHLTIAEALLVDDKLKALKEVLGGDVTEENLTVLNDDWMIEEDCIQALQRWGLNDIELTRKLRALSGGQKTKVFLAGISLHKPDLLLLDEPSNHLDKEYRALLYKMIQELQCAMLVVSHDRQLLNLLDETCEISRHQLNVYGGNYEFYIEQKVIEQSALDNDIAHNEKQLRKAKEIERDTIERQQKLDARGKKKQEKAGVAKIMMNTLRNSAEKSTSKAKSTHADKVSGLSKKVQELRSQQVDVGKMKLGIDDAALHKGKEIFTLRNVNYEYDGKPTWHQALTVQMTSGERIAISGKNGSGKTTLIKLLLGEIEPKEGSIHRADVSHAYIDQEYSIINNELTMYEQAQQYNDTSLEEHEIKIRLDRFLFGSHAWDKKCNALSGGERMRLILCCLSIKSSAPDVIVLDEPTNNLDLQNVEILTSVIRDYKGTLIVVSHDAVFLEELGLSRTIDLDV